MDEIGLFPLGLVLLPAEHVPLHIFEPRYRELIRECVDGDVPFGLVYASDGGLRKIGTLATVVEVTEEFDDGNLSIVVEGGERFRLVELTGGRTFATATIALLDDQDDPPDPANIERSLALLARLADLTSTHAEPPATDTPQLSFSIAGRFALAPDLKQELLEERSERIRLERLCEVLEIAAETFERQQEIAVRAKTNGSVHPPG